MDHNDHEPQRKGLKRSTSVSRWLAVLSTFALLGIFVSPISSIAEAAPIGSVTVTLSPATQTQVVGGSVAVTATVRFTNSGLPAPLQTVTFTVSGANPTGGTRITGGGGQATFSYTGTNSGTDTVSATVGSTDSNSVTVTWTSTAATLSLTPATQTAQIGDDVSIDATLYNPSGTAQNIPIIYTISGVNSDTETVYTDSTGSATITYTSDNIGIDTITAFADLNSNGVQDAGEPSTTATVTWIGITITLSPSTQTEAVGSAASIDATVLNGTTGVSNARLMYTVAGANSGVGGSAYTDVNGDATFHYNGSYSGTDTVTAWVDLNSNSQMDSGEPSATATVIWTGAGLTLSPSTQSAAVGSQASVAATLTNPNVSVSGVPIRYTITGANSGAGTVYTGTGGSATISYTGATAGTDTISAFADLNNDGSLDAGEPSATATVTRTGATSLSLSLSPAHANAIVGTTEYVSASLTSMSGGAANVVIRYSVAGANPTSGTATTDGSGNTVISYTGSHAGTDTLSAFADLNGNGAQDAGEPTAVSTVTWAASPTGVFQPAQPASAKSGCTYFPQTQHNLCAGFQAYWNTFGGLAVFGMPLTEEFQENGTTVQYFERARFEWHPGAYPSHFDVLLGLLGNEVTQGRGTEVPFMPAAPNSAAGCTYYAPTGHNLCGGFAAYWNQFGGLAIYGYPISEEFQEKNPDTGQVYTVQYFQRARFEWHPGAWPSRFDVELGRLGAQVLQMKTGVNYY